MRKIKKLTIILVITVITLCSFNSVITNADDIIINYKDNNGVKSVDIIELAKAMNININKNNKDISMTINDKILAFNEDSSYLYIDGKITTFAYTKVEINEEEYKLPALAKITKDGDGYLLPVEFVEEYLGIKADDNYIIVKVNNKISTDENKSTPDNNTRNINSNKNSGSNISNRNTYSHNYRNDAESNNVLENENRDEANQDEEKNDIEIPDQNNSEVSNDNNSNNVNSDSDEVIGDKPEIDQSGIE